jgi:hypothetical protein
MDGSLSVGIKILWIWISNPVLIVSSMLAPFAIMRLLQLSGRSFAVSQSTLAALLVCTFAMPLVLQFPAWWAMGGWPPARTVDAIYFLFLVSWFATIGAVTIRYLYAGESSGETQSDHPHAAVAVLALSVLFSFVVLESKAYRQAKTDLFELAPPYNDYLNKRYAQIEQALANEQLYLVVADYKGEYPQTIFFNDIMHDPGHWRNVCYADYFGLEKIKREYNGRNSDRSKLQTAPQGQNQGLL